jgi:hypothetical protein
LSGTLASGLQIKDSKMSLKERIEQTKKFFDARGRLIINDGCILGQILLNQLAIMEALESKSSDLKRPEDFFTSPKKSTMMEEAKQLQLMDEEKYCSVCHGHGRIWDIEVALSGDNGYLGDCKNCKGTGKIPRL